MYKSALVFAVALLAGCGEKAISINPTDNAKVPVERLFTHDGCTVYRFNDNGAKYFVRCDAGTSRTEWTEQRLCGKTTCSHHIAIPGA